MALNPFEVEIIDDEVNQEDPCGFIKTLGISTERHKEIERVCDKVYVKWRDGEYEKDDYTTLIHHVSKYLENANELSFVIWKIAYGIGFHQGRQQPGVIIIG